MAGQNRSALETDLCVKYGQKNDGEKEINVAGLELSLSAALTFLVYELRVLIQRGLTISIYLMIIEFYDGFKSMSYNL